MRKTTLIVSAIAVAVVAVSLWLFQTAPSEVAAREMEARLARSSEPGNATAPPPALTVDAVTLRQFVAAALCERVRVCLRKNNLLLPSSGNR